MQVLIVDVMASAYDAGHVEFLTILSVHFVLTVGNLHIPNILILL